MKAGRRFRRKKLIANALFLKKTKYDQACINHDTHGAYWQDHWIC
jgi:hypothetical protein